MFGILDDMAEAAMYVAVGTAKIAGGVTGVAVGAAGVAANLGITLALGSTPTASQLSTLVEGGMTLYEISDATGIAVDILTLIMSD